MNFSGLYRRTRKRALRVFGSTVARDAIQISNKFELPKDLVFVLGLIVSH